MDFTPTVGQSDVEPLAARILADRCTPDRLAAVEAGGDRFDRELWHELGTAGLLGLAVPETYGGAGLGLLELTTVLVEAGKVVAPEPLAPHTVAALALARWAGSDLAQTWLPRAATGEAVLTVAVAEDGVAEPRRPGTTAVRSGQDWVVTGTKTTVVAGVSADLHLVPAATDHGVVVLAVPADAEGLSVHEQRTTDGDRTARLELDGVRVPEASRLGDSEAHGWLLDHLAVAHAALQLGVCEGALRLTADYARTREQFGRPIGTFQAVSQRLADGFIDVAGLRLTVTQAAWRLAEGLPAEAEVATARLWACDTGHTIAHTAVHVHGGVGIDLDAPAHRYFTAAKRWEMALGGTTLAARAVGRVLAAEPV
ncbi:acyl-CoA dehydrogenase family protein [Nocardioides sp. HDW12B]|uniref:acyl-CoA dehydrogenase family protein n=1 Tax=Nocardioides sp. HDW12B TaxID=2714939 RepID=UPI00140C340A|nr:acyl-CoA dehydrogenase family protein [Nocardioides sp. HDW12B]QIK66314.1 acyl-CoA dehydrogenase family protein [Nocardioides sp. HDW12B]